MNAANECYKDQKYLTEELITASICGFECSSSCLLLFVIAPVIVHLIYNDLCNLSSWGREHIFPCFGNGMLVLCPVLFLPF